MIDGVSNSTRDLQVIELSSIVGNFGDGLITYDQAVESILQIMDTHARHCERISVERAYQEWQFGELNSDSSDSYNLPGFVKTELRDNTYIATFDIPPSFLPSSLGKSIPDPPFGDGGTAEAAVIDLYHKARFCHQWCALHSDYFRHFDSLTSSGLDKSAPKIRELHFHVMGLISGLEQAKNEFSRSVIKDETPEIF